MMQNAGNTRFYYCKSVNVRLCKNVFYLLKTAICSKIAPLMFEVKFPGWGLGHFAAFSFTYALKIDQ